MLRNVQQEKGKWTYNVCFHGVNHLDEAAPQLLPGRPATKKVEPVDHRGEPPHVVLRCQRLAVAKGLLGKLHSQLVEQRAGGGEWSREREREWAGDSHWRLNKALCGEVFSCGTTFDILSPCPPTVKAHKEYDHVMAHLWILPARKSCRRRCRVLPGPS